MKNLLQKLADLSTQFDKSGLTKEAAKLDGLLLSLSEEEPSWLNPIDKVRWKMKQMRGLSDGGSIPGREMMAGTYDDGVAQPQATPAADSDLGTPLSKSEPAQTIGSVAVTVDGASKTLSSLQEAKQLVSSGKVSADDMIKAIFTAVDPSKAAVAHKVYNVEEAFYIAQYKRLLK